MDELINNFFLLIFLTISAFGCVKSKSQEQFITGNDHIDARKNHLPVDQDLENNQEKDRLDLDSPIPNYYLSPFLLKLKSKVAKEYCENDNNIKQALESLQCRVHEQVNWDSQFLYQPVFSDHPSYNNSCIAITKKLAKKYLSNNLKGTYISWLAKKCDELIEYAIIDLGWNKKSPVAISQAQLISHLKSVINIDQQVFADLSHLNHQCSKQLLTTEYFGSSGFNNLKIGYLLDEKNHKAKFIVRYLYPVKLSPKYKKIEFLGHYSQQVTLLSKILAKNWGLMYYQGKVNKKDQIENARGFVGYRSLTTLSPYLGHDQFIDFSDQVKAFSHRQLITSCDHNIQSYKYSKKGSTKLFDFFIDKMVMDLSYNLGIKSESPTFKPRCSIKHLHNISKSSPIHQYQFSSENKILGIVVEKADSLCRDYHNTLDDNCLDQDKVYFYTEFIDPQASGKVDNKCVIEQVNTTIQSQLDNSIAYQQNQQAIAVKFDHKKLIEDRSIIKDHHKNACRYQIIIDQHLLSQFNSSSSGELNVNDHRQMSEYLIDRFVSYSSDSNRQCFVGVDYLDLCNDPAIIDFARNDQRQQLVINTDQSLDLVTKKYNKYCKPRNQDEN